MSVRVLACVAALLMACGAGTEADSLQRQEAASRQAPASEHPDLAPGTPRVLDLDHLPGGCGAVAACGDVVAVDCGSAADGPFYLAERGSGRILEYCGGYCMLAGAQRPEVYCREGCNSTCGQPWP